MAESPKTPEVTAGPVSLTPTAHAGVRIKNIGDANHIAKNHFSNLYTPEFSKAGVDYPIIFVKDPATDVFFAACMWGLEPGENLFVEDGVWTGGYYPAAVRCYPFAVQPDPEDKERLFIGIYETASIVNKEEGNLIFDEEGKETEWMLSIKDFLVRVYQQQDMTRNFVSMLDELDLLSPQALSIKNADTGENHDVSGFFVVDREKLKNLPEEKLLELRKSGALEVIYYHLMSLESLDKLLRKKNIRPAPPESVTSANDSAADETPTAES